MNKIIDAYIGQFEFEMISTLKMIERVPFEKFDWKPHEKSMDLGGLARHIVAITGYGELVANHDEVDFANRPKAAEITSSKELIDRLKLNITKSNTAITTMSDQEALKPWTLRAGENVIFDNMPKIAALRGFCLSHLIHHRGQLSVYLRLLGIAVPSIYGPSADENPFAKAA